jgi:threonine dehydrogenase-like Zn-dependent dehydrogenase
MKAAVFHTPRNFKIEDIPYPRLEDDSVIVKVRSCGICGSDLHFYNSWQQDGTLLGHEFSGDVVEIGKQVTKVKVGDKVVAAGGRGCGECYWCRSGHIVCVRNCALWDMLLPVLLRNTAPCRPFKIGEYAAKFPARMAYPEAATAEPLAVALYAVNQMQPARGDTAVVID